MPILVFCLLEYLFIEKNSLLISLRWDWYSKYIKQILFSSGFWNIHKIGCWKFVVFHVTPWRLVHVTMVFSLKFFKSCSMTLKLSLNKVVDACHHLFRGNYLPHPWFLVICHNYFGLFATPWMTGFQKIFQMKN